MPKFRETEWPTSCIGKARLSSFCIDVTGLEEIPHGTIKLKKLRSVFTFIAMPCEVTPREMCTPRAAIFDSCSVRCVESLAELSGHESWRDGRPRPPG